MKFAIEIIGTQSVVVEVVDYPTVATAILGANAHYRSLVLNIYKVDIDENGKETIGDTIYTSDLAEKYSNAKNSANLDKEVENG